MTTAYVKLEMELELTTTGKAAIVFQPLATADFEGIVRDMEEVVSGTGEETGTTLETTDDEFGYRWMVLARPRHRGPRRRRQRGLHRARGRRLRRPHPVRGVRLPRRARASRSTGSTTTSAAASTRSCPRGGEQQRDTERELRLKAQIGAELPIEAELERWFPLWGIPI